MNIHTEYLEWAKSILFIDNHFHEIANHLIFFDQLNFYLLVSLNFLLFHQHCPIIPESISKYRKLLERAQTILDFSLVGLVVFNVIEEVIFDDNASNFLSNLFLQVIVTVDFDIYNAANLIELKILGYWAFIMSNHENKGIFGFLINFFNLLLHNFFMVRPS